MKNWTKDIDLKLHSKYNLILITSAAVTGMPVASLQMKRNLSELTKRWKKKERIFRGRRFSMTLRWSNSGVLSSVASEFLYYEGI